MLWRAQMRGFPHWVYIPLLIITVWFGFSCFRFLHNYRLSRLPDRRLSERDLQERFNKDQLEQYTLGRFGGVLISKLITDKGFPVQMMIRDEPEPALPFSGWTFISGKENDWKYNNEVELHDPRTILRIAPEVFPYLDALPGVTLEKQEDGTFVEEKCA